MNLKHTKSVEQICAPPPQEILCSVRFHYLRRAVSCMPDLTPATYEVNYVQPFPLANT